jgi:hypothetical protein
LSFSTQSLPWLIRIDLCAIQKSSNTTGYYKATVSLVVRSAMLGRRSCCPDSPNPNLMVESNHLLFSYSQWSCCTFLFPDAPACDRTGKLLHKLWAWKEPASHLLCGVEVVAAECPILKAISLIAFVISKNKLNRPSVSR